MHYVRSGSAQSTRGGGVVSPGWSHRSHRSSQAPVAIVFRLGVSTTVTTGHFESSCDVHRPPTLPDFKRRRKSTTMLTSTTWWTCLYLPILLIFTLLHFPLHTDASKIYHQLSSQFDSAKGRHLSVGTRVVHQGGRYAGFASRPRGDLQASDSSLYYETYPLNSTATTSTTVRPEEEVDKEESSSIFSQGRERPGRVNSYPIGEQSQAHCDQLVELVSELPTAKERTHSLLMEQRIIVESEQMELFLRLHYASAYFKPSNQANEFGNVPVNEHRAQCEQMLQNQLESSLDHRRVFELATSTFNVSCHLVFGPQFQCALFAFNTHHFASIFKGQKEQYCGATLIRFNLLDHRCQLSLTLKQIPSAHKVSVWAGRYAHPPIVSSIWETLQETLPLESHGTSTEAMMSESCFTLCQRSHRPHRQLSRSKPSDEDLIVIENAKPKCSIHFDTSAVRNRLRAKSGSHSLSSPSNLLATSSSSSPSNSNSQLAQSQSSQSDQAKKTCIESSRHILTHNGLVIKHPTLRLISTTSFQKGVFEPVEGLELHPLEFFLQLESKSLAQNAQYFDLVLKKYKWSASVSLLYPEIYPGILTGQTSVPVESAHHHQASSQHLENVYFRFVFDNLKITKWGYRYLLKISLRSNPACYTIETTFGPFDVGSRQPGNEKREIDSSTPSNDIHFVWTTHKCHSLRINLQGSVVVDRVNQHVIGVRQSDHRSFSVPTSRFIDYFCELNLEKFSIFLINFLANRASNTVLEMLPPRLRSRVTRRGQHQLGQKEFIVRRDFSFTQENNYPQLVHDFIVDNRFDINGTQCLQMNFRSKNVSMLHHLDNVPGRENDGQSVQELFDHYYQSFVNFQKQQLRQKLINMTFIYSSELLLKIRQIYLDDTPLYIPSPLPSPASEVKKTFKKKPNGIANQPKEEKSDSSRIVEKRKSAQDENRNAGESATIPDMETTTQVDRSRKISNSQRPVQSSRRPNQNVADRVSTSRPARPTVPKQTSNINRSPSSKQMPDDEDSDASESKSLASKPLIWILILFANTLLVFAFIILLAICYYRKIIYESTSGKPDANAVTNRKPLRPLRPEDRLPPNTVRPVHRDDVFMLEKTDYASSSGSYSSYNENDSPQQVQQRSGEGGELALYHHEPPRLKSEVNRVQNANRFTKRAPPIEQSGISSSGFYSDSSSSSRSSKTSQHQLSLCQAHHNNRAHHTRKGPAPGPPHNRRNYDYGSHYYY